MNIEAGQAYYFRKSGNEVRAIAPAVPEKGVKSWEVERTQGASKGKRMLVAERALVRSL